MNKTDLVKGRLEVVKKLYRSFNGNPRYKVKINDEFFHTEVDSTLGYSITNYDNKTVIAQVRRLSRKNIISDVNCHRDVNWLTGS